ncbi:TPA: helix-turn-helix domain-containing protein [Clostridioides difficile]
MSEKDGIIRLNLIELRKILKLTQEEMSASLKISRSNYGNIETGKVGLTERVKSDICDIYNVNKEWLETGTGEIFSKESNCGKKINELRKKRNLTSEQLSELSNVPKGTLDKILNGTTKDPKFETLKSLARALNCTLNDFDDMNTINTDIKAKEFNYLFTQIDNETKDLIIGIMKKVLNN